MQSTGWCNKELLQFSDLNCMSQHFWTFSGIQMPICIVAFTANLLLIKHQLWTALVHPDVLHPSWHYRISHAHGWDFRTFTHMWHSKVCPKPAVTGRLKSSSAWGDLHLAGVCLGLEEDGHKPSVCLWIQSQGCLVQKSPGARAVLELSETFPRDWAYCPALW